MSHETTTWASSQKVGNSPAKFVLMVLADYADTEHSCFPSVGHLSKITELGESTVRKALALLTEHSMIRVYGRYRPDGSQRSSRYQLLVHGPDTPRIEATDWTHVREGGVSEGEGGSLAGRPGGVSEGEAIPISDPPPSDPSPVVPAAPQRKTATRVPDDFQPTDDLRAWFVAEQLGSVIDGKLEHEKFMDYWRAASGANARKHDWPATWRNWMRRAAERAPRRPGTAVALPPSGRPNLNDPMGVSYQPGQSTTDDRVMQGLALVQQFRLEEENKA